MKKYPLINLRLSQDLKENLDYLTNFFGISETDGAYPKVVRMAVRSLKYRLVSLHNEFGKDFTEVFKFKIISEMKKEKKF